MNSTNEITFMLEHARDGRFDLSVRPFSPEEYRFIFKYLQTDKTITSLKLGSNFTLAKRYSHQEDLRQMLQSNTSLTSLDLSIEVGDGAGEGDGSGNADLYAFFLRSLAYRKLNQLILRGCTFVWNDRMEALSAVLSFNTSLTSIDLSYTGMDDGGVDAFIYWLDRHFKTISGSHSVSFNFNLSGNRITAMGAAALLRSVPVRTSLNLSNNPLGRDCALFSVRLQNNRTVTHLSMRDCNIGDLQTWDIVRGAIGENTYFKHVDISDNVLNPEGAYMLANALLGNKTLTSISLSTTKITSILQALVKNISITKIRIFYDCDLDRKDVILISSLLYVATKERCIRLQYIGKPGGKCADMAFVYDPLISNRPVLLCDFSWIHTPLNNETEQSILQQLCAGSTAFVPGVAIILSLSYFLKHCNHIRFLKLTTEHILSRELAEVLTDNKSIASLDLAAFGSPHDYAKSLQHCTGLLMQTSRHILYMRLDTCFVGPEGSLTLAEYIRNNVSLLELHLRECYIDHLGMLALAAASKWRHPNSVYNTRLRFLDLTDNANICSSEFFRILEFPSSVEIVSNAQIICLNITLLFSACLERDLATIAIVLPIVLHFSHVMDGSYSAVAAALLGDMDQALQSLQEWPQYAEEVIKERHVGSWFGSRMGVLRTIIKASRENPLNFTRSKEVIDAATMAAKAIHSTIKLNVINVHLCGEGYAGKTKTKLSLLKTLDVSDLGAYLLPSTLPTTEENERRTLGMERAAKDCKGADGAPVRVLIHDYGGQVEFRANHATHLRVPNSAYVIVVPMWDLRPGPTHNSRMDRKVMVDNYKNWLKYIYTIASGSVEGTAQQANSGVPHIITVVNFASFFKSRPHELGSVLRDLTAIQTKFNEGRHRLNFVGSPISLDSIIPEAVRTKLVPKIKEVAQHFYGSGVAVAPCLATVLADMEIPDKWPMFSTLGRLQELIYDALEPEYINKIRVADVRHKVLDTIVAVTQSMLESRRDILILSLHGQVKTAINNPNWLTEKLLGNLFDPAQRTYITKPMSARAGDDETHLLDIAKINAYVSDQLDQQSQQILQSDRQLIPRLLQHIGVCIPVVVENKFLVSVAEDSNNSSVQHWFPAFSITPMSEQECAVLPSADHIIAREFKLEDEEFSIFPHGYFSSLFVCIVSLYNISNRIVIRSDGMELKSNAAGADCLQIIVRMMPHTKSFVVVVAAVGTATGGQLTLAALNEIKKFIFSDSDWRGAVRVVEHGINPESPYDSVAIEIVELNRRICDPRECDENLRFHIGVKRVRDIYVQEVMDNVMLLQIVLVRVETALRNELMPAVVALRRQLMHLSADSFNAIRAMQNRIDAIIELATNAAEQRRMDMKTLYNEIAAVVLDSTSEDRISRIFSSSLAAPMQLLQETLKSVGKFNATELATVQDTLLGEIGRISEQLQDVSDVLLLNRDLLHAVAAQLADRAVTADAVTIIEVREALRAEISNLEKGLSKDHENIKDLLTHLGERILETNEAQAETMEQVLALRDQIVAVRNSQNNTTYDMYNLPLLVSITKEAKIAAADSIFGNITRVFKKAKRSLYKPYRVTFACAVCGKKAKCGADGLGYEMLVTKQWIQNAATALKYTLFAVKVISLITPYALPHLDKLADYVPGGDAALKSLEDTFNEVKDLVTTLTEAAELLSPEAVTEETPPASLGTAANRAPPVVTLAHVASVRSILQVIGETIPPRGTGLECVVRSEEGECTWLCCGENGAESLCKKRYKSEPDNCHALSQYCLLISCENAQ